MGGSDNPGGLEGLQEQEGKPGTIRCKGPLKVRRQKNRRQPPMGVGQMVELPDQAAVHAMQAVPDLDCATLTSRTLQPTHSATWFMPSAVAYPVTAGEPLHAAPECKFKR